MHSHMYMRIISHIPERCQAFLCSCASRAARPEIAHVEVVPPAKLCLHFRTLGHFVLAESGEGGMAPLKTKRLMQSCGQVMLSGSDDL
jgi:hypothetical protein